MFVLSVVFVCCCGSLEFMLLLVVALDCVLLLGVVGDIVLAF